MGKTRQNLAGRGEGRMKELREYFFELANWRGTAEGHDYKEAAKNLKLPKDLELGTLIRFKMLGRTTEERKKFGRWQYWSSEAFIKVRGEEFLQENTKKNGVDKSG